MTGRTIDHLAHRAKNKIRVETRKLLSPLRRLAVARGLILLYHRVTRLQSDPQLLAVTPEKFEEQLQILQQEWNVIPLQEMARAARENRILDRSVAITFDDGYADNLLEAKPILEHRKMPATFFIATSYIGGHREFWWDEVERLILSPSSTPPRLELNWENHRVAWPASSPTEREAAYRALLPWIRPLPAEGIDAVLDQIRQWLGVNDEGRPTHRPLTGPELIHLAAGEGIEIGPHTRRHVFLGTQSAEVQVEEISGSKEDLEGWLGLPMRSFSYPFGTRDSYTETTLQLMREIGFEQSVANYPFSITGKAPNFELPRFLVRDWDAATFRAKLNAFYEAV